MLSGFIKNMDNSKNLCLGIVSANYSYNKLKEECIINSGRALQEIFTPIRVFILYRVREMGKKNRYQPTITGSFVYLKKCITSINDDSQYLEPDDKKWGNEKCNQQTKHVTVKFQVHE